MRSRLHIETGRGGAVVHLLRGKHTDRLHLGPNEVHAFITHPDGSTTDLGISYNLITNSGKDYVADALGGRVGLVAAAATGSAATSLTKTAAGWTVDAYKGMVVWSEQGTAAPVYGNVGTNSATVLTVDQWWNGDDTLGTTPGATADFQIKGMGMARFMGLSNDTGTAPAAAHTDLSAGAGEITTGGAARALATYAHTAGTSTYTLSKAFAITATFATIHKMGLFTAATQAAGGVMVFETALNADASVVNGDTLTVTETVTLS